VHLKTALAQLRKDYDRQKVAMVAINTNDWSKYPDDSPQKMVLDKKQFGYDFPYLIDESQSVAKSFEAACTPEFYLFNKDRKLVYRGQFDDSRPGSAVAVTGKDLRLAIDALLRGAPISEEQKPSLGCNIKWRAGNEPSYFG
jgi:hypothetical protein